MKTLTNSIIVAVVCTSLCHAQDAERIKQVEDYFNSLEDLKADVDQFSSNSTKILHGSIRIRRPIINVQFDNGITIIVNGHSIKYYNSHLNDLTEHKKNPFSIFLKKNIDLQKNANIKSIMVKDGVMRMLVESKKKIGASITLVFSIQPFELRKWIIKYENGVETTMLITNVTHHIKETNDQLLDYKARF